MQTKMIMKYITTINSEMCRSLNDCGCCEMQISASYCLTLWSVMGKILRLVHESGPRVQSMDQVHEGSPRTWGPRFVVSPLFHEFVLKLKNSSRCRLNVLAGMYCSQCGQRVI